MKGVARKGKRKAPVSEREPRDIANLPAQVVNSPLALELASALNHGRRDVKARDMAGCRGKGASEETMVTAHIEHAVGKK